LVDSDPTFTFHSVYDEIEIIKIDTYDIQWLLVLHVDILPLSDLCCYKYFASVNVESKY